MLVYAAKKYGETLGRQHPETLCAYHELSFCHAMKVDYKKAIIGEQSLG